MAELPSNSDTLVVRTGFSNPASWERLREVLATPNEYGFLPYVDLVDDPRFAGATHVEMMNRLPGDYRHPLLVLADEATLASSELPLVVVDLWAVAGRSIRVVATELWGIENNLSIRNMDFDDFVRGTGEDGVFRGFSGRERLQRPPLPPLPDAPAPYS